MSHAGAHVLFFAVVAAASPLALTATFVVIRSARPRANGIAFLAGFLAGSTIACGLGLVLGQAAVERVDAHGTIAEVVAILLGAALIVVGIGSRRMRPRSAESSSRGSAILAGLRRVRPGAALSMAGLLGFGGPKRLLLTFLAMASISQAELGDVENLTLVAVYLVVATVLVWVPVTIVVVAGERAAELLGHGEAWLTEHSRQLQVWLSLGLGGALVADGLIRLTT